MKIIVGLSGGPDSMFLTFMLSKKKSKKDIILAHFNHGLRKESDNEEKKLRKIFKGWNFISDKYKGLDFKESSLRKARYNFFKKVGWGKYWLILGHNLTDRIETSFLNLIRGCGLKGFLNMRKIDYNQKILRPLINIPKYDILKKCELYNIPYFIDKTNFDVKISKRNLIRKIIINFLENKNYNFYYSFNNIYTQIEKIYPVFNISNYLVFIDKNYYKLFLPNNNKEFFIKQLLDYFGVFDIRKGVINEILDYIYNAKSGGFKKYGNLFFLKSKGEIFLKIDKQNN